MYEQRSAWSYRYRCFFNGHLLNSIYTFYYFNHISYLKQVSRTYLESVYLLYSIISFTHDGLWLKIGCNVF